MSNFKIKHNNKTNDIHVNTLDENHRNNMYMFQSKKDELPLLKKELQQLKNELNSYENENILDKIHEIDNLPKIKSLLRSKIKTLENKISDIENDDIEMDYYFKTQDTIMEYYDLLDENDIKNALPLQDENPIVKKDDPNKHDLLDRLNMMSKENAKVKRVTKRKNKNITNESQNNIMDFFAAPPKVKPANVDQPKIQKTSKAELLDQYLSLTDSKYSSTKHKDKIKLKYCEKCNIEKKFSVTESMYACDICGSSELSMVEYDKMNNKDITTENKAGYPYKKINHLNEWLSQFQAKESINIPKEVYDNIIAELNKNKITDYSNLSVKFMKENILKTLKYETYYEHTVYIVSNLSGIQPPTINKETEEKIRLMFRQLEKPFAKYKPKNRVNFLSYSYTLHKIFQLLELDEFLKYFPLLKSREKLMTQDESWKKICNDLNWEFYPSI